MHVALPMASLPLSTSAPAKRTISKSKPGSLLRRVTKRNARAQEVREFKAKYPLASQKAIAGQLKLQRSMEILYTADFTAEEFQYSTWWAMHGVPSELLSSSADSSLAPCRDT